MRKFFLMTRGRTGSTAIIDEMNNNHHVCADQELFINRDFSNIPVNLDIKAAKTGYNLMPPFGLWRRRGHWWVKLSPTLFREGLLINSYLAEAESETRRLGAECFGFKVLSHHFDERRSLDFILKLRNYSGIYLTRNISRQVLSGIVAKKRGIYNVSEVFEDTRSFVIDLDEFQTLVEWERLSIEKDRTWLVDSGFNFIIVTYEEFRADRQLFFDRIFRFLGVPSELPAKSTYTIMIKNLRSTIENYDAVVERAAAIGAPLDV